MTDRSTFTRAAATGNLQSLVTNYNANLDVLEQELENTLSRKDNVLPNSMEDVLDMNGYGIINVGEIETPALIVNGVPVEPSQGVTADWAFQSYTFTATASQTSFSVAPYTPHTTSVLVEVNGLSLPPADVSVSGTSVVIPACTVGDEVVIRRYTREPSPFPAADDITFNQAGTVTTRTVQNKLRESVSVKDFGAVGDGVTNDTVAIQSAITACNGALYFPSGVYKVDGLVITNTLTVYGDGSREDGTRGTTITNLNASSNIFIVNENVEFSIRDVCIKGMSHTSGAGIVLQDSTPSLVGSLFASITNVRFEQLFVGINAISASSYSISDCVFWNIGSIGISIDNTFNKDQGDQSITGNTFLGTAGKVGIQWTGGGGTRITNNKFLVTRALVANLSNATANETGQFLISNNSFDCNVSDAGASAINIFTASGTVPFSTILISGNIFIGYYSMDSMLRIYGISSAKISGVIVTGNTFTNTGASFANAAAAFDHVDKFLISSNIMLGNSSGNGVVLGSNCTNGTLGSNEITGFSTKLVNNSGINVRVRGMSNSGATASVADGGTITHGLGVTPAKIFLTGDVAAQTYTAFSPNSTTFSVSNRDTAGASGTAATIYWTVES